MDGQFIKEVEEILHEKSLLNHPFYKLWTAGKLSVDALRGYAKQYYFLEAEFPRFLLQTGTHAPTESANAVVMENYAEETAKEKSHVDMWLDFASGLGLEKNSVKQTQAMQSTVNVLSSFDVSTKTSWLSGMAALLAYEANLQETSMTKLAGLQKFYGVTDKQSTQFFEIHGVLDLQHSNDWKNLLVQSASSAEQQSEVKNVVGSSMEVLWKFLDGIYEKYNCDCMAPTSSAS